MDRKIGCLDRLGQGLDKAWTEKMGLLDGFGWCSEVPFSGLSKRLPGSSMIAWATRGTRKKKTSLTRQVAHRACAERKQATDLSRPATDADASRQPPTVPEKQIADRARRRRPSLKETGGVAKITRNL